MESALPAVWANYISMLGFVILGIIVWRIPRHLIYAEAPDNRRWRDIRIWATVLIGIQLCIYAVFS